MELSAAHGRLHHVEIWVEDYPAAKATLGWLFEQLGYQRSDDWGHGGSWKGAGEYLVLEAGPDVAGAHQRLRAGLNHLAFAAGSEADVEQVVELALGRGWTLMFADEHPYAGGSGNYAAYMSNPDGFEVELVADPS